jgi:TPR repeat protein
MKYLIAIASVSFVIAAPAFASVRESARMWTGRSLPVQLAEDAPAQSSVFGGFGITYPEGTGFGRQLSEGAREVDFFYEWSGAKPGEHHIEVRWLKEGAVISQSSNTIDAVAGKTNVQLKMSNGEPLPNGSYKVEWTDNGQPMPETEFTIGKPSGEKSTKELHEVLKGANEASDINAGLAAMQAGDYQRAISVLQPAAAGGNVKAQQLLGIIYTEAPGVKNYAEAVKWLQPAAEHGDPVAQTELGNVYANGGDGVVKDDEQSAKWYRVAAEQGEGKAQRNLGAYYVNGIGGVPRDPVQAYTWEILAIERLNGQDRDLAVQVRDIAAQGLTAEQRQQAESMAKDWKPKTQ